MTAMLAAALVACFLFAGVIAAIESALLGVPKARVDLAVEHKERGARSLMYWVQNASQILTTLQFVRFSVLFGAGVLFAELLRPFCGFVPSPVVVGVAGGSVALVLSHITPRALGRRNAYAWAERSMGLVRVLVFLLAPAVAVLSVLIRLSGRVVGLPGAKDLQALWASDQLARISQTARAAGLDKPEEDLLRSIIEFSDTVIREIMVPRTGMVVISIDSDENAVHDAIISAGHSRLPVYEDTIDNIRGVLHIKDLVVWSSEHRRNGRSQAFSLTHLMRQTFYVPEVMKISELLREFQRRKTHMAIVVDEYGGTAGVVTLEDIIEEIVGEIQDEYDVEDKQFRVIGDKILADASVSVWDIEDALGIEFPDDASYETLAGFLMWRIGYLPAAGAVVDWRDLRFTVKDADERRIRTVEIERLGSAADPLSAGLTQDS